MKALLGVLDSSATGTMSFDPVTGIGMGGTSLLEPTRSNSPARISDIYSSSRRPRSAGSVLSHAHTTPAHRENSAVNENFRSTHAGPKIEKEIGSPMRRSIAGNYLVEEKAIDNRMSLSVHQTFMQSAALSAPMSVKDDSSAQLVYGAQFSGLQVSFNAL